MPSPYSPSVYPMTVVPSVWDALNQLVEGGRQAVERRRERELEDETLGFLRSRRGREEALGEAEAFGAGIRRGTAPTREVDAQAPPIFQGERPGMARGTPGASPLAGELGAMAERGRPRIIAPAGAFVPGLGFAPRNLTDADLFEGAQVGLQRPRTREETDPRFRQLTEGRYLDVEGTPEAREAEAERERRERLSRVLGALQTGGRDPELLAEAVDLGLPASVVFDDAGPEQTITEDQLRAAGVPERSIPAALADQDLARQLIGAHNRPQARGSDPYGGRTREQYLEDLEEAARRRARVADEFDERGGDPRLVERRDALAEALGDPINEVEQNALDALARGIGREDILLRAEELVETGQLTEDELKSLERYLDEFKLRR